jgi:hypothetical protein
MVHLYPEIMEGGGNLRAIMPFLSLLLITVGCRMEIQLGTKESATVNPARRNINSSAFFCCGMLPNAMCQRARAQSPLTALR